MQHRGAERLQRATDRCIAGILLADWPRPVQAAVIEEIRRDQARRRLLRQHAELAEARALEEAERHRQTELFWAWIMRRLFGHATPEDIASPCPKCPEYGRTPWGLRVVPVDERKCWTPLGRVVPTVADTSDEEGPGCS